MPTTLAQSSLHCTSRTPCRGSHSTSSLLDAPQTAFDWWMSDTTHRNEVLNASVTEMGVGYAYMADTTKGYFTVDFASP